MVLLKSGDYDHEKKKKLPLYADISVERQMHTETDRKRPTKGGLQYLVV